MKNMQDTFTNNGYPERWIVKLDRGQMSDDEHRAMESWLGADVGNRQRFAELSALWYASSEIEPGLLKTVQPISHRPRSRWLGGRSLLVGSMLTLAVVLGFSWWPHVSYDIYVPAGDSPRHFELADGSKILAAPGARLELAMDGPTRGVKLLGGEAVFEVEHDTVRPFVVSAGAGTVTVTGTRFGVALDEDQFEVGLLSGSIDLKVGDREPVRLQPDDYWIGTMNDATSMSRLAQNRFGWEHGTHVFVDTPVQQILQQLEPFVGLSIKTLTEQSTPVTATLRNDHLVADLEFLLADAGIKTTRLPGLWLIH